MANIGLSFGASGGSGPPGTRVSFWVKTNTPLTHRTALVDCDGGGIGYLRVVYNPEAITGENSNWVAEASYRGATVVCSLTPVGFVFQSNAWYWLSVGLGGRLGAGSGWKMGLAGQVWGPGGATPGRQAAEVDISSTPGIPSAGWEVVPCSLGWGVPLSSTYNPFPLTTSAPYDAMADLCIETTTASNLANLQASLLPQPTANLQPTSTPYIVALYPCSEGVGSNQVIHDATANQFDLAAATSFNGDAIVADSPYI